MIDSGTDPMIRANAMLEFERMKAMAAQNLSQFLGKMLMTRDVGMEDANKEVVKLKRTSGGAETNEAESQALSLDLASVTSAQHHQQQQEQQDQINALTELVKQLQQEAKEKEVQISKSIEHLTSQIKVLRDQDIPAFKNKFYEFKDDETKARIRLELDLMSRVEKLTKSAEMRDAAIQEINELATSNAERLGQYDRAFAWMIGADLSGGGGDDDGGKAAEQGREKRVKTDADEKKETTTPLLEDDVKEPLQRCIPVAKRPFECVSDRP